ncbi:MAG: hypothetical protein KDC53_23890 [Saprospiraceae bacterium]|nr:hypothetical protein [Saprospiraceae bacterium]
MKFKIQGKVIYENLSGGFWGIKGTDGKEYLPVNMPEQLKVEGANVEITAEESDQESIFMWGQAIKIVAFHTIPKF